MADKMGNPCPICRRMDGGHDQPMHDAYEQGGNRPDGPPPKPVP